MIDIAEAHEVHLTVELGGKDPDVLATLARVHGCRFLHVLLDTGTHPSQPMLSWRQAAGIDTALKRAAELAQALEHQGMKLLRTKIEGKLEVTVDAQYFEAHFKVELDDGKASELQPLARELGVHLSRSAFARSAGKELRFLTARQRTFANALESFERVETTLTSRGFRVLSVDREAVLYDSNLGLDEGWST
jgi:hypothetical protein